MDIRQEFVKAVSDSMWITDKHDYDPEFEAALWGAKWMGKKCASVANHYMADQTNPAKCLAASDIKIMIRTLIKQLESQDG